jgi:hypothetical protein
MSDKYAEFGRAVARATFRATDENAVWREIVRAHIRLEIEPYPEVIRSVQWLVAESFRAKEAA